MRRPLRIYLVGGTIAVDRGLRELTLDVDYAVASDDPLAIEEFERLIPQLKNDLDINLEPASPADFLPVPRGVLELSPYVRTVGPVMVYHYDLPTTVLSKVARGAERDLHDVEALVRVGAVAWDDVEARWAQIRASPRGWIRHTPEESGAWQPREPTWAWTHRTT
jgi:hypothetical protein